MLRSNCQLCRLAVRSQSWYKPSFDLSRLLPFPRPDPSKSTGQPGVREHRTFKTVRGAHTYVVKWIGESNYDMGDRRASDAYGIQRLVISGATFSDLGFAY